MDENRRQFIASMAAIFGAASLDGFGLLKVSAFQTEPNNVPLSRDLKDYPHITDVFPYDKLSSFFPIVVDACSDPAKNYLAKIPFLIELEVCKIWKESSFRWNVISGAAAGGLEQFMEVTAKELCLAVADSPEIQKLKTAISEYRKLNSDIASRRQALHKIVDTGVEALTQDAVNEINKLRVEIGELNRKLPETYQKLTDSKAEYITKIESMTEEQRAEFDARFVPKLAIPAGVGYLYKGIMECQKAFGGSIEINVWRGVAAYNSGLGNTKRNEGLPFIEETVRYTRVIVSNLTKALELKYAYSTKDTSLIAQAKSRLGISNTTWKVIE